MVSWNSCIGIAVIERSGRKIVMSSLLEEDAAAVVDAGEIDLSIVSSPEVLMQQIERSVRFEEEEKELTGPSRRRAVKKRIKDSGSSGDAELSAILDGDRSDMHLTHLIALYGDVFELLEFREKIGRIADAEKIGSVMIMTARRRDAFRYEWTVFSGNAAPERYFCSDPDGSFPLSFLRRIADGRIKGEKEAPDREEKPAPAPEVIEEPAPAAEAPEEPAPAPEATEEPAPAPEVIEEPAPAAEAPEEPIPAPEAAEEPAPAPEAPVEPEPETEAPEEFRETLFPDEPAGIVFFYADGSIFRVNVEVKIGTGQVFNYGFPRRRNVAEEVKGAYLAFREASDTVSPSIDCRAYDYTISYECLTEQKKTAKLSLPTLIALCSANLQKSVDHSLLVMAELTPGDAKMAKTVLKDAVKKGTANGFTKILLPGQGKSGGAALGKMEPVFYRSVPEAVRLAIGIEA